MLRIHLHIAEGCEIVAGLDAVEVSLDVTGNRLVMRAPRQFRRILLVGEQLHATVFKHRLFGRQGTGFLIFGSEVTGGDLTGFHIRLIEWIDADDRSRHSGGDLPTEELLTQIVNIRQ